MVLTGQAGDMNHPHQDLRFHHQVHQLGKPLMMDVSTLLEPQRLVTTRLRTRRHTDFIKQATATHSNIKGCDASPQMGR